MSDLEFKKREEKILKFWNDREIFERSVTSRKGKKRYVFFEGPPTANGKPGIHHVIARAFKDLMPRYKTMRGYYVERRGGWDTHGLPVELEVEKELGFKNKKEIEAYGIAKFNAKAKQNVWKYLQDWQEFTKRIGFWVDLKHPYVTYDPNYIESLWWVIAQFDKKKLLYEGHKVLPWCTRCGTALSSHEVAQGYADVTDTSVYVKFKILSPSNLPLTGKGEAKVGDMYLLAWTTTPWTLPGNVALAVGEDIDYVLTSEGYILAKSRVEAVLGNVEIVREFKGKELVGLKYEPLFDVKALQNKKSHTVYAADFVTTTDGTGIVHTAVMYGEDDYELGKKLGLPMHHTVGPDGHFTSDVPELAGQYVKKAEKAILQYLDDKNLKLKIENYTHSYPFCWRCKTPLLYYAKDSWFVGMSGLRKQLIKNNSKINWVPAHLKEGRFGEFLKEAKDWAFSRERYWGTPLPVWKCSHCTARRVIGSYAELETHRYRKPNTYILLRHGESTKNLQGGLVTTLLENDDYDLTERGRAQAKDAAEQLKAQGGVDVIIASPFLRAKKTAQIVADALGEKVHIDERLKEITEGMQWEGKSEAQYNESHKDWDFDMREVDGESWNDVRVRMSTLVQELAQKYEGKRILLVSHGDPLWLLVAMANQFSEAQIRARATYPNSGELIPTTFKNYPYNERGELDPHRPYIDEIELRCDKCEGTMTRVKEVVDVWFDSGAMPFAQWHYPFEHEEDFKQNYPADYISEAIDQTRGWFYTLLAVATALGKKAPYKNVISMAHVLDEKGKKMSKSLGNVISPWDVIEQYGVDPARWYFYSVNNPGDTKLFALTDVAKVQRGFLTTLMNCLRFLELYDESGGSHKAVAPKPQSPLDDWILSRLHSTILLVTKALDAYDPTTASRTLESFVVEDLSKWWIRRSRDRFPAISEFLRYLLLETSKLLAPFIPFTAEHIYKQVSNRRESVHLEDWPLAKNKYIDLKLEEEIKKVRQVVTLALALRKTANIKVRQPLASLAVKTALPEELAYLIQDEVNVKRVLFAPSQKDEVTIDTTITESLKIEGFARELARAIQEMRKDAGYAMSDTVSIFWQSESKEVEQAIAQLKDFQAKSGDVFDLQKEFELASGVKVWLGIRK